MRGGGACGVRTWLGGCACVACASVDGGGGCGGGGVLGDGDPAIAMVLLMTQASQLQAEQWLENLFNGDEKLFQRFLDLHSMDGTWTDGYGIMCQVLFTFNSFPT